TVEFERVVEPGRLAEPEVTRKALRPAPAHDEDGAVGDHDRLRRHGDDPRTGHRHEPRPDLLPGLQIRRRRAGDHLDPPFPVPHGLPLLLRPTPTRAASPPRTDSTAEPTGRVPTEELTRR